MEAKLNLKESLAALALWIASLVFVGLGVALMIWPTEILAGVDVIFETPTAFADIRADYGGCIFGLGFFLVWCASQRSLIRPGLICVGLVFSGYSFARILSLAIDGQPKRIIFILLAVELCGAFVAFGVSQWAPSSGKQLS
ncbi:DUF4345 domain-containing protein [Mariniblastus sp.]|nr:DUF4345 domain-containing protein [bacterium]MDA7902096.1 DUF4345 domain-containing protein [Mariniblastus sp.]MDA7904422.1 DUF4345 domain-containing protein [bacterium]MDB4484039.1 DUF4345 domain-containing protein [bacterium]